MQNFLKFLKIELIFGIAFMVPGLRGVDTKTIISPNNGFFYNKVSKSRKNGIILNK